MRRVEGRTLNFDQWVCRAVAVGFVGSVISIVAAAFDAPLGYDESWNLQVAQNLTTGHGYATNGSLNGGGPREFDALMSTGPTLLLPVAGLVAVLGSELWVYRLVPVTAFAMLLLLSAVLGHRVAGRSGAVACAAAVLGVAPAYATSPDSVLVGPGDVLGEVLATALVVGAALCLARPRLCGLVIGLAVLTKVMALLCLPAVLLGVVLHARRELTKLGLRRFTDPVVEVLLFAGLPLLAYQGVRVALVGFQLNQERNEEFIAFFLGGGSGVTSKRAEGLVSEVGTRLQRVAEVTHWTIAVAAVLIVLLALGARLTTRRSPPVRPNPELVSVAVAGATVMCWWTLMSSQGWVRHALPGVYLVGISATAWICRVYVARGLDRFRRLVVLVGASVLAAAVCWHAVTAWNPLGPELKDQRMVAKFVRDEVGPGGHFSFVGWYQAPDIALLSGVPARRLTDSGGTVVLTPSHDAIESALQARVLELCDQVLLAHHGFLVCEVQPGPLPEYAVN